MKIQKRNIFQATIVSGILASAIFSGCASSDADEPTTQTQNIMNSIEYQPKDGIINLYGAGGPHTALIRVADVFTQQTGIPVKVNFGSESSWTEQALSNADIMWGTSEQSMTAFLQTYTEFDSKNVEPIYIRKAVIAVQKGNPSNIQNFNDLLKEGMSVVVTEGAGVYNTSGTGVWEDVAGRLGSLEDVKKLRKNITVYGRGSGASYRAFKAESSDAWITWGHWPLTHTEDMDLIEFSSERNIYRDLTIVTNDKVDENTGEFIQFLKGNEAFEIFKTEGWTK